jgi:kumamolisin
MTQTMTHRRHARRRSGMRVMFVGIVLMMMQGDMPFSVRAAAPTTAQTRTEIARTETLIGRTNAAQPITLAVPLKPHDPAAVDRFLTDLYNPASPDYHAYLTPKQYTQRFFDAKDRAQVTGYLRSMGLAVSDPGVGAVLTATGNAAQVEGAFHLTLSDYRDTTGRIFYANDLTPALPQAIAALIDGVTGLDTQYQAQSAAMRAPQRVGNHIQPEHASGCAGALAVATDSGPYVPNQLATAYRFTDLYAAGFHGENQKIAILELSNYHDTDITTYQGCFGTNVPITRVNVNGGSGAFGDELEVDLDLEVIAGMAPNLQQELVYIAPNTFPNILGAYQQIANDDAAPVVSTSWLICEAYNPAANRSGENTVFQQMAAQGQTIFAADGDYGSTGCKQFGGAHADDIAVDDPASQPYVTGVGGTNLAIAPATNAYTGESVWNNRPAAFGAGGGGLSIAWPKPAYQAGPGVANVYSNGMREVPDITGDADCLTGYTIFVTGAWEDICGTSGAAPLWAAATALLNPYLIAHGGSRLGFANPALYALSKATFTPATSPFHDVTTGDNCFDPSSTCGTATTGKFPATAGFDLASGIGSFHLGNLAPVLLPPQSLPNPRPAPSPLGSPAALPASRPPGPPNGTTPNPLPSPRP